MDSASHTSGESVYHSCSENSAWDSDQDDESQNTPASSRYLGSIDTTLLSSDSETLRLLVCLNAARVLLAEISNAVGSLLPLKGKAILKRILAIGTEWKGTTEAAFGTIVALPIFQSSLGLLRSESRPCCQENIDGLVAQLRDESSAAIIAGQNDALTIVGAPSKRGGKPLSFIVFNPQCRASTDLGGASLRFFPTVEETVQHVYNITAIHRGGESNAPRHMYSGYILVPPGDIVSPRHEIASQYQANIRLLQETLELKNTRARGLSSRAEIGALQARTELELQEERNTFAQRDTILAEIVALKFELDDIHAFTAVILDIHPSPETPAVDIDTETEKAGKAGGSGKAASSKRKSLSDTTSPITSRRSESSTPPTSPETLWNAADEHEEALGRKSKSQAKGGEGGAGEDEDEDEEEEEKKDGNQEAQNSRAHMAEQAASLSLAHKLVEEGEIELANSSLECPCCLDKCHKGFMVNMEGCDHLMCKTCMQDVTGQTQGGKEAHGSILCPVCTEE